LLVEIERKGKGGERTRRDQEGHELSV